VKGIHVCSNKGPGHLQKGDNHKNVKMGWGHLKIFFSRTIWPILTRVGTNHPWMKGIQVCSKKGECPSPRGDNSKIVKILWTFLKMFFRTRRPNSTKLCTNYPWVKGIHVCSNEGSGPFQRGDNHNTVKNGVGSFKNLLFQTNSANFKQT
jgi:hypothetical protein